MSFGKKGTNMRTMRTNMHFLELQKYKFQILHQAFFF